MARSLRLLMLSQNLFTLWGDASFCLLHTCPQAYYTLFKPFSMNSGYKNTCSKIICKGKEVADTKKKGSWQLG